MKIRKSSGNVFADIGFGDAEAHELALKSDLITPLMRTMRQRGLSQKQAARLCGIDQPTLSKVLNGRLAGVSIGCLARWLVALGSAVTIRVDKPRRHRGA